MLSNHWDIKAIIAMANAAADRAVKEHFGDAPKGITKQMWDTVFIETYQRLIFGHRRGEWHSDANAVKNILTAQS